MSFNKSFYQSSTDDYLTASTGKKLFLSYPISQGSEIFSSNLTLKSTLTDSSSSVGLSGQVLSSTGIGTNWTYNSTNGYLALDLSSLPYTLALSSANTYIYITGGTVSGGILTIPTSGIPNSSYLVIRNNSLFSFNISTSLMTFTQGAILSTISVAAISTIALFYNGTFWIQSAISDTVNTFYTGTIYSSYVATDNLSQAAAHSEINMFSDTTYGDIFLGKILPSPYTVRICNTTSGTSGGSVHLCNIGFDGININNATTPDTGNLRVCNSQTTGTLFIGGGSATRTSGPIIIGSDTASTGGINIGTQTGTTAPTANTVNLGSSNTATIVKGTFTASSLNASTDTGDMNISTSQTTGVLNIGTGLRLTTFSGGAINIGTGSAATNPINIGGTKSAITLGSASTSSVVLSGSIAISKPITMPTTYIAPTISQLGWTDSVSNTSAVSVSTTIIDILTTGTVLPLGSFLVTFYVAATFSAANAYISFRFTEGTGVNIIGKPGNDNIVLTGASSIGVKTSFTYTIPVTSTNTGNNGEIVLRGINSTGTATISIGFCKISWIKIS
jgi:hypothetical protein